MEPHQARSTGGLPAVALAPAVPEGRDRLEADLGSLTTAQRRAVESDAAPLCILAGPGAGKTRVLTLRLARRIRDGAAEADHTVACTFTRKAARELRERLECYGLPVARPTGGSAQGAGVRAGTIHQLALGLLRRHAADAGGPAPVIADRSTVLRRIVPDPAVAAAVDVEIGWAKARGLAAAGYAEAVARSDRDVLVAVDRVTEAFTTYEASLFRSRRLDLDDLLLRSTELLETDDAFGERTRWRYRHLSVDEFQDINPAQFAFVRAILGPGNDLCVVGDPNQAIYGWNGADPSLLHNLGALFDDLEVLELAENLRSTPQVVAAASAVLHDAGLLPAPSRVTDGPAPIVTAFDDANAEAEGIAAFLLERSADGVRWEDQAVLTRTRDQLVPIAGALGRAGIPCHVATGAESAPFGPREDGEAGGARAGSGAPKAGRRPTGAGVVELTTFHRSKGLEWAAVCIAGVEDGFVPSVHASSVEAQAEERRLLYVALTRASRDLHCSWARIRATSSGRAVERRPSPWLAPLAAVSVPGTGRIGAREAGRRIAALRATLEPAHLPP